MVDTLPTRWLNVSHHSAAHIAARYPYCGYGSNLWLQQIAERCPQSDIIGRGRLRGARLAFAKVATIIADENVDTLVGVYDLTEADIETMDRREGLGRAYDRYLVTPEVDGNAVRCFTYIKRDATPANPTDEYFAKLLAGYRDWQFPERRLRRARDRAIKEAAALPKKPEPSRNWEPWGRDYEQASRPRRHPAPKSANRVSLVTGRNLDREPRLFEHDESIASYLSRHEHTPSIAKQITQEGDQTTFYNHATGEHWKKAGGVWRRVKQ